jgi:hypothetical protein
MLVPDVDQSMERKFTTIENPWEIRTQFQGLKHTEKAAIEFLNRVGVWKAVAQHSVSAASAGKMLLAGSFGYETFFGRALPITLEELWAESSLWKNHLLSDEDRLRAEFSHPPPENAAPYQKMEFALKANVINTQRLHIVWQSQKRLQPDGHVRTAIEPQGLIQPFTGWDLLVATTHVDLLRKSKLQVCQRHDCGNKFTGREAKFCSQYCGHLESMRKARREKSEEKKRAKRR